MHHMLKCFDDRAMVRVLSAAVVVVAGLLIAQRLESREAPYESRPTRPRPIRSRRGTMVRRSGASSRSSKSVTNQNGPDYVPPPARIAVFDNDGTLWSEQPLYVQLAFALDRVKALAPQHPEWRTTQPFQAVLENDQKALGAAGVKGLAQLVLATHAGMITDEFERILTDWFATGQASARQPALHRDGICPDGGTPSATSGATDSRPTSSPAAESSSCAGSPSRCMGSPPSRSLAAAGSSSTRFATGRLSSSACQRSNFSTTKRPSQPPSRSLSAWVADRRVRELRWRSADVAMDRGRGGPPADGVCRPH